MGDLLLESNLDRRCEQIQELLVDAESLSRHAQQEMDSERQLVQAKLQQLINARQSLNLDDSANRALLSKEIKRTIQRESRRIRRAKISEILVEQS